MPTIRLFYIFGRLLVALLWLAALPGAVCADEADDASLWRGGVSLCGGHNALITGQNIWGDAAPTPTPTPTATPTITPTPQIPANMLLISLSDTNGAALSNAFVTILGLGSFVTNQLGQIVVTVTEVLPSYTAFIKRQGYTFVASIEIQPGSEKRSAATGGMSYPTQCAAKKDLTAVQLEISTNVKTIHQQLRADLLLLPISAPQRLSRQAAALELFNRVLMLVAGAPVTDVACKVKVSSCKNVTLKGTKNSLAAAARRMAQQAISANRTLKTRKVRTPKQAVLVERLVKRTLKAAQKSIKTLPAATSVCS